MPDIVNDIIYNPQVKNRNRRVTPHVLVVVEDESLSKCICIKLSCEFGKDNLLDLEFLWARRGGSRL